MALDAAAIARWALRQRLAGPDSDPNKPPVDWGKVVNWVLSAIVTLAAAYLSQRHPEVFGVQPNPPAVESPATPVEPARPPATHDEPFEYVR